MKLIKWFLLGFLTFNFNLTIHQIEENFDALHIKINKSLNKINFEYNSYILKCL